MNTKRISALLLAGALLTACGGCGKTEEEVSVSEESSAAEMTTEKETLPSGVYEPSGTGLHFDLGEIFDITKQDNSLCQLECKDEPIYAVIKDCHYMIHTTSMTKAQERLEELEEEYKDCELSVYDNPYSDCVRIRYTKTDEDEPDTVMYLDENFVRMEYSAFRLILIYPESYIDEIDGYTDHILSSVTHESPVVAEHKGGTIENDFISVDYSDKFFADESVYPDDIENAREQGDEIEQELTFHYNMSDLPWADDMQLTVKVTENSVHGTYEEYADYTYDSWQRDDINHDMGIEVDSLERSEETLFGHKGCRISLNSTYNNGTVHITEHIFGDGGRIISISERYSPNDNDIWQKDINELMDSIILK